MCARLLACPLCSQPGFLNLDSLRAGLVSVATRPLACPVCNEVLLGIEKLTIHLFSHTINQGNVTNEQATKIIEVNGGNVQAIVRNGQTIPIQSWNLLNATQTVDANGKDGNRESSGIYIPIDEIENFRNLTAIKEVNNVIPVNNGQVQSLATEIQPSQLILLQNVSSSQPNIFSANLIAQTATNEQHEQPISTNIFQAIPTNTMTVTTSTCTNVDETSHYQNDNLTESNVNEQNRQSNLQINGNTEKSGIESYTQTTWSENGPATPASPKFPPSYTDRLEDLVKNAQISSSPLSTFHDYYESKEQLEETPRNASTPPSPVKPIIKSSRLLTPEERTERCNICGFHFADRHILILHKQLVHMIQEKDANIAPEDLMKNYPCHLCTKVFKMRGSLMVHMRVAHPGVNTSNIIREITQQTEEQMTELSHETETSQNNDSDSSTSNHVCSICGKFFKKEQHVLQHMKIHDGKQWECDVCSKLFTTKYFLKKHKRLHSGEMPYKCTICDKTFTFQQSFHKHRLYHKDEKPHSCSVCGRSFKELSTLHNHERIHTGEKPFACETCGKCFRQRVSYLVHRRIHTGVMPYTCPACGKTFRYKVSQRTHKCPNLPSDSMEESEIRSTQENCPQTDQNTDEPVTEEENQYIFVLNEEGKHVIKKQTEIENKNSDDTNKSNIDMNKEDSGDSVKFIENMWNQDSSTQMEYRENNSKNDSPMPSLLKDPNMWNETSNNNDDNQVTDNIMKRNSDGIWNGNSSQTNSPYDKTTGKEQINNPTTDFFSMVMSPLENQINSPSAEMEHLKLSSPTSTQENTTDVTNCFSSNNNNNNNNVNPVQVDENNFEDNFSDNANLSTLQTINEDSLKELLSSLADNDR